MSSWVGRPVRVCRRGRGQRFELLGDALGAHRGLVVHPARAVRAGPQQASLAVADGGGLDGVLLLLPETKARRPGRLALGRRTWVSAPSIRRRIPSAPACANTSARGHSRTAGRSGTAKPRAASSGRISPMARETVERAVPYSAAGAACGSPARRWTRVASGRSVKTRSYFGPAPACRRRPPPRRSSSADSCRAGQESVSCRGSPAPEGRGWPGRCRRSPRRTG